MAYFATASAHETSPRWIDRIASRLDRGIKAAQYGKMLQAMSALTDDQLAQIDLQRKDIPLHAHRAIYGTTPR